MPRVVLVTAVAFLPLLAASRSAQEGVFSEAQVTRGRAVYHEECAKCHNETLAGSDASPELAGSDFRAHWNGRNASDLVGFMKATMPPDDTGRLKTGQYVDLAAYILSANGFPSGSKELGQENSELSEIKLDWKK